MRSLLVIPLLLTLAGCNWISNVSGLSKDANKAVGAACRQSGRSLEECYQRNPDADKAQIYAGWREMHEYMVKQKLETIAPPAEPAVPPPVAATNGGHKQEASAASAGDKPHAQLSPEEADKAMRNDPQVAAVLAAIRRGGLPPAPAASAKDPSDKEKQLLDVIQQLNKKGGNASSSPAG
jgi:hypothetical protein